MALRKWQKHNIKEQIMAIIKFNKSQYYYADYLDISCIISRILLQTKNMRVAHMKYDKIIRSRNAVKEMIHIRITWQTFKDKLIYFMSVERARNTTNRMKLAIRYLEEIKKPWFLQDVTPQLLQRYKEHLIAKGLSKPQTNSLVQCIKTAMHLGKRWVYVHKQDWTIVTKIKVPHGRVVFHTPEKIDKILAAYPNETWRIIVGADA